MAGDTVERIAATLGARVHVRLDWNGEALDRLLDREHAAIVETVLVHLRAAGWEAATEATFNIAGERGSIDVLAFHAQSGTLLVVEVKSVVPDVQATLMSLDRKVRLAPRIAAEHGWRSASVATLVAIGDSRTSRRRVERHATTFALRLPDRAIAVRRFIANPAGRSLAGLWFLSSATHTSVRHRAPAAGRAIERGSSPATSRGLSTAPGANR